MSGPDAPDLDFGNLFKDVKINNCAKSLMLVSPYEEPRGVFFIRSGYVRAYTVNKFGETKLIAILGPREVFPLYWALDENFGEIFYESINAVTFNLLPKVVFKTKVFASKQLLQVVVSTLLATFRFSHQRIQNLQLQTAKEKLAWRLLYLADNFGTNKGTTIDIAVPVVYQDLADALGITRETTNRVMRHFITERIVERTDHHLKILDYKVLKNIIS